MDNIFFSKKAYKYWKAKEYWSIEDVLNICWGGLEHTSPVDYDEIEDMKSRITQAISSGALKANTDSGKPMFKRDEIVKWSAENLNNFPFKAGELPKVKVKKYSGRNHEDTQLRMIGALALLLAQKHNKYKKGDKPNQSQIAKGVAELFEHLQSENPNLSGMGQSNLRNSISEGLKKIFEQ